MNPEETIFKPEGPDLEKLVKQEIYNVLEPCFRAFNYGREFLKEFFKLLEREDIRGIYNEQKKYIEQRLRSIKETIEEYSKNWREIIDKNEDLKERIKQIKDSDIKFYFNKRDRYISEEEIERILQNQIGSSLYELLDDLHQGLSLAHGQSFTYIGILLEQNYNSLDENNKNRVAFMIYQIIESLEDLNEELQKQEFIRTLKEKLREMEELKKEIESLSESEDKKELLSKLSQEITNIEELLKSENINKENVDNLTQEIDKIKKKIEELSR